MNAHQTWALDVVDEDLELPGWLLVPSGLTTADQEAWLRSVTAELVGTPGWNGEPVAEAEAREALETGLALRSDSDALAMFQIFPAVGTETVNCYINVLPSAELMAWRELGLVQPAESPHLGPGLQCSTHRTIEAEGNFIEVAGVHFAFDNGVVTLLFSLDENLAPLISRALPGFVALMQNVRMNSADGDPFVAVQPEGIVSEAPWPIEDGE